ncbi:MAG: hypothetical protein JJU41_05690 [Bacteroidetes bacterium]|nr:hypothetical protein [Bacteroidota bacterium]MCH8524503.1 hypothetical protein [Balneolales bacterium]
MSTFFTRTNAGISVLIATVLLISACGQADESATASTLQPYEAWFASMASHCGNAYAGGLTTMPPGDDMITFDDYLVVHFRECSDDILKVPFHIQTVADGQWDRSRTWIFTKHEDGLELRHDHRKPDGSDDEVTMYGGFQYGVNEAGMQIFQSVPRTEETGIFRGWRIEIDPGVRYTYGTVRGDDWSWRIDFDLTQPIDTPPAPWGHE